MVNSLDYHPCSSRLTSRIHPSYFCKLRSALSLFKMLVEFSLRFYIPSCVGDISNLWRSSSYKMHWFEVFLLIPLPTQNSPPIFCHQALGRRILLILRGSIFSTRTAERGKENWFYLSKFSQKIWKRGQNCSKRKKRHIVRINLLVENRLHGEFYRPNVFHYRFKIQWLTWTSHCRSKNLKPANKSLKNYKFGF